MTLIILYFAIATVILYHEARECCEEKSKLGLPSLVFALLWPVSLPFAIYTIWRGMK